jgi:hypothetical protein
LAGFYPNDPVEGLVCDEVMDSFNEMMSKFPFTSASEEEKKQKREEFQAGLMKMTMDHFEKRIQEAGGSSVVASGLCVADVLLMTCVKSVRSGFLDYIDNDFFSNYPGITASATATEAHPKVKAYYDSLN